MTLKATRKRFVDSIGPRAVHAIEDGATSGVGLGLAVTYLPAAVVLLLALGSTPSRAGPIAVLRELIEMVRSKDARAQEAYFTVAFLVCIPIGAGAGSLLSAATAAHGITIGAADILAALA